MNYWRNATRFGLVQVGFVLLIWVGAADAQWRIGRVLDGDSLMLYDASGQRLSVRLAGIDAPERGQAFSDRSQKNLKSLVADCQPEVKFQKIDRYGRSVCQVFCDTRDLGLAQLEAGLAWHFSRYAQEQPIDQRNQYFNAQQKAQADGSGLWRDASAVAPWTFREQQRAERRTDRNHERRSERN
jgi:endonuclease YncB( thermonuclease family)